MSVLQLDPLIPMNCPKGSGYAHFMIDYSPEMHLYWVIFITATGECWTYANPLIRIEDNITLQRVTTDESKSQEIKA